RDARRSEMRKTIIGVLLGMAIVGGAYGTVHTQQAQPGGAAAPAREGRGGLMPPVQKLEDAFVRWPVPSAQDAYASIDGKRIHQYVVDQANISRRYRDQGHPQFWGRIIGTSSDAESAQWVADKFKA